MTASGPGQTPESPAGGSQALLTALRSILGSRHVLTGARRTERYRKGFRSGEGEALAVAFPGSLLDYWRVLKAAVEADAIIIFQAANTGLTEGSSPKGSYDRPVLIINTLRLDKIHLLRNGEQALALPGATLFALTRLLKPLGREPHSVIGSSSIGATVVGGICNNSGGALTKRGPAYTEMALYARRTADGALRLVNHLGLALGDTPEEILGALDRGELGAEQAAAAELHCSDPTYDARVRDVDADSPARYNANPTLLRETAGCAGKLAVFAVRVDTFPADVDPKLFYIGSETTETLTTLRRRLLKELPQLPILGEYIHRDCFEIAERYGKDTFQMIKWLGTDRLPLFFTIKGRIDAICRRLPLVPNALTDLVMQGFSRLTPRHLPKRLTAYRDRFEHHLIVQAPRDVAKQTAQILSEVIGDAKGADFFECDAADGAKALLHRFAAAGAAMRFGAVRSREVEGVISLDIALRRNDRDWFETLPSEIEDKLVAKIYYGHLFCHVFHQDYVVKKGVDTAALKRDLLALLEQRGAEYPAEHNVGHIYEAKPALKAFYAELDPTNTFNPGIGKTARERAGLSGCDVGGAEPGSRVETYPPAAAE